MLSPRIHKKWLTIIILGAIVFAALLFRLHNLESRTIGHIEMYVPGIELPYELSDLGVRMTLRKTLSGTLQIEPHPPAYYILMLGWTKVFGSGILALRLPSVLFGVACIVLIYVLCLLEEDRFTGLLAAGMLAFNGLHIFWSQEAKLYIMGCFLGLLSTVFLVLMPKGGARQKIAQFVYLGSTLAGLATTVYFWPIFITHVLWTLTADWRKKTDMPGLFRFQILIFTLGSVLLAVAAYQGGREPYIGLNLFRDLCQFLQFGFLFEPDYWSVSPNPLPIFATIALVLFALFLVIKGTLAKKDKERERPFMVGPPSGFITLSGVLMFLIILILAKWAHEHNPSRTMAVIATSMIPLSLPAMDVLLRRYWSRLQNVGIFLSEKLASLSYLNSLNGLLAIVPVSMIIFLSIFTPLLTSRGSLLFIPYFIIILSRGLALLVRRRLSWIILVAILVVVHVLGMVYWRQVTHSPTDYKGLAEQWIPHIENSDLIFVERHWVTTPIFYYVKADHYHFVGKNYTEEIEKNPASRIWVLRFAGFRPNEEMKNALRSYRLLMRLDALRVKGELYGRIK
jgi:4-amino-4-deoxy-L-arabinose transferase-like glycosyltransferase